MLVRILLCLIGFTGVLNAQTFTNTVTVQKDLRVQGETVLGGVTKLEDITMYADTIHIGNLDGTGNILGIDANNKVYRIVGSGTGGVTGLNDQQVLYGSPTGTLDQEADLQYDEDINTLYLTDETSTGQIILNDYDVKYSYLGIGFLTITNSSFTTTIEPTGISFSHGPDDIIFNRQAGGSDYTLYWPNADGSSGQFLRTDGSGNLSWAAAGTVTSIATTSPITGGTITGTGTIGINNAAADGSTKGAASFTANDFDASSGNISIDYTNGQKATTSTIGFLTDTDWDTFNNKVSFDITGQSSETTIAHDDEIPIYDVSEAAINKITAEDALAGFNRPDALRNYKFTYFNEFLNTVGTATGGNDLIATNSGTGAGTNNQATDASNRVGLVRSTTGTTATGRTSPSTSSTACAFGGGTWVYEIEINLAALSTVTQRYQLVIGFLDVQNAANQTDAIAFVYDEGGVSTGSAASANWQTLTSSNSTRTWTTTGTAVATGWTNLRIEVNAGASSVTYYVNGVAMGTSHTTNIPSGTSRTTGFGYLMIKSIGTTASTMDVDYIFCESDFTTNR